MLGAPRQLSVQQRVQKPMIKQRQEADTEDVCAKLNFLKARTDALTASSPERGEEYRHEEASAEASGRYSDADSEARRQNEVGTEKMAKRPTVSFARPSLDFDSGVGKSARQSALQFCPEVPASEMKTLRKQVYKLNKALESRVQTEIQLHVRAA